MSKLDPRTRLVIFVCISTAAILVESTIMLTGLLVFTVIIVTIGGALQKERMKPLIGAIGTVLFVFILQAIFGNVLLGFEVVLRLLILIFSAMILLAGHHSEYLRALIQMKVPYELAYMVILSFHFLPMLKEEAADTYYSMQLRGTELKKCSMKKKIKAYRRMCMPILAGAIEKAKDTSISMEARGFRTHKTRTSAKKLKLKVLDITVMVVFIIMTAIYINIKTY